MDPNWHALYIHSTCVSNRSTGMHYGMDYEILCIVDGTFVPAYFVPFRFVRHQKKYQTASIEFIKYVRAL